jgi:hypothetical protein
MGASATRAVRGAVLAQQVDEVDETTTRALRTP